MSTSGNANLNYWYDATGAKLTKVSGTTTTVTTDYLPDGIQYTNGNIDFIKTAEGRILNITGTPNFEYTLADHLGNTRVTFDSSSGASVATQTNDYYPFGLSIQPTTTSPPNLYLYNKKELQTELGQYDYGARFYDPVIARWGHIDPKAELYFSITPYAYAANTPVNAIDPDGHLVIFVNGQHGSGTGGNRSYWRSDVYHMVDGGVQDYYSTLDFAQAVEDHFHDYHERYYDGAMGGWSNTMWSPSLKSNLFADDRIDAGYSKGQEDAAAVIESLSRTNGVITESIKVVAHSMGAAYSKGYIKALVEYAQAHPEVAKGLYHRI